MKVLNFIPLKLTAFMLVILIISGGCKRKGPFDYFEETAPIVKDEPEEPDNNDPKTVEPGNNIGDVGQVVFSYRGQNVVYKTVRLGDGSIWLQQNLGSEAVATASDDFKSYGDLFQWGRWDDGHQVIVRNSNTLANNSTVPVGSSVGIDDLPTPNDPTGLGAGSTLFYHKAFWWNGPEATVTASKPEEVTANNGCDPCKAIGEGWRLPTKEEWEAIRVNENRILGEVGISSTTPIASASAFVSVLKLPAAGFRLHNTGRLHNVGSRGLYWSSTGSSTAQVFTCSIDQGTVSASYRGYGFSVRCLKK